MGLSGMHLFLLLILVVVVFGPARLPKLGRSFGDAVRGFKKGLHGDEIDVTDSVQRENLQPTPPQSKLQDSAEQSTESHGRRKS